jgi:hypothetical protein
MLQNRASPDGKLAPKRHAESQIGVKCVNIRGSMTAASMVPRTNHRQPRIGVARETKRHADRMRNDARPQGLAREQSFG